MNIRKTSLTTWRALGAIYNVYKGYLVGWQHVSGKVSPLR